MASNIRYLSTRGESTGASYDEIVLRGLASDGGLFMPLQKSKMMSRQN